MCILILWSRMNFESKTTSMGSLATPGDRLEAKFTANPMLNKSGISLIQSMHRRDLSTSAQFGPRKHSQPRNVAAPLETGGFSSIYEWPLKNKNASIEEKLFEPISSARKHMMPLKSDMSLNTMIESAQQIKNVAK